MVLVRLETCCSPGGNLCDEADDFRRYDPQQHRAFVSDQWDYYADTGWEPIHETCRSSVRMLSEAASGLRVIRCFRTASVRPDKSAFVSDWQVVGAEVTAEGDSDPEDLTVSGSGQAWIQWGHAIKREAAGSIGVGSVGVQWNFPTARFRLWVEPGLINLYEFPVNNTYAEVLVTSWRPFYQLEKILVALDAFDADNDLEYTVVLQTVRTDPSLQAPTEDTLLAATTGVNSAVAQVNSFTNGAAIKAQLCRLVVKAKGNQANVVKRGRIWFSASLQMA